ncbi:MFS transporter [Candidatus Poriferisocius sp.]|uniref:MFS transporter n=1 Tax=Candidatus Poriferisocius sp. TaxID=3101276 RepID=UPI003B0166BB
MERDCTGLGVGQYGRVVGLRRSQLVVVWLIGAAAILPNASIAPAIPDIADAFGISDQTSVFILMTAHAPGLVMASVIGVAADRYGRRRVAVPCLLVFGLGGLAIMASDSLLELLVFRFVQGLGSAGFLSLALVIIGDHYRGTERIRVVGQNSLSITLAVAVLPAAGGLLTELFGWRGPFAMHAATLVLAGCAARLLPPDRTRTIIPLRHQLREARPHLLQPEVGVLLLVGPFTFLIFFAVGITTMPIHLENAFGASAGVRGLIQAMPAVSAGLVALSMGRIAGRYSTSKVVRAGYAGFLICLMGMAVSPSLAVIIAPVLLLGAADQLVVVPLQSRAASLAPDEHRAVMVAAWGTAIRIGQVSGPPAVAGLLAVGDTRFVFWIAAALSAVLLVLITMVDKLLDRDPRFKAGS